MTGGREVLAPRLFPWQPFRCLQELKATLFRIPIGLFSDLETAVISLHAGYKQIDNE